MFAGVGFSFADGQLNLIGFTDGNTHFAFAVAHNNQGAEPEAFTAFYHLAVRATWMTVVLPSEAGLAF